MKKFLFFLIGVFSLPPLFSLPLLQMESGFSPGFEIHWTLSPPEEIFSFNPNSHPGDRFKLNQQNLPDDLKEVQQWSFFFTFHSEDLSGFEGAQTLFLQEIGKGYAIYLNGHLVDANLMPERGGRERTRRYVFLRIPRDYFQDGENLFVFRIQGSAPHPRTGLSFSTQAYVGSYEANYSRSRPLYHYFLVVTFLVSILFQIGFAFTAPSRGLHQLVLLSLVLVFLSVFLYGPLAQSEYWFFNQLGFVALFFYVPVYALVLDHIGLGKSRKGTLFYTLGWAIASLASFFFPLWPIYEIFFLCLPFIWAYSVGLNLVLPLRAFAKNGFSKKERFFSLQGISLIVTVLMLGTGIMDFWNYHNGYDFYVYPIGILIFTACLWLYSLGDWNRSKNQLLLTNQRLERLVGDRTSALLETNKELEDLVFLKNRFMSILAHDLKSPLGSINYLVDYMNKNLKDLEAESLSTMLRDLFVSSQSLGFLLENLLNWSFDEEVDFPFKPAQFDPKLALDQLRDLLRLSMEQKDLKLDWDVPSVGLVYGDPAMIALIARNLLANAIKFTQKKKTIGVRLLSEEEGWIMEVRDQGIGMEQDLIKALMEGRVARKMSTGKWQGTGLGMVMAVNFIRRHGGTIRIQSEVHQGSVIQVWIPRVIPKLLSVKEEEQGSFDD